VSFVLVTIVNRPRGLDGMRQSRVPAAPPSSAGEAGASALQQRAPIAE
jgi:hypothetical protein